MMSKVQSASVWLGCCAIQGTIIIILDHKPVDRRSIFQRAPAMSSSRTSDVRSLARRPKTFPASSCILSGQNNMDGLDIDQMLQVK